MHNRQPLFRKDGDKSRHLAITNKRTNSSQAGGSGGGGKLRKFQVPTDVQIAMVCKEKGGAR